MDEFIFSLNELIEYKNGQIRSRSMSRLLNINMPLMIYALDRDESISVEQTSMTKLIQLIDGKMQIKMNEKCYPLEKGEMIVIPPNSLHEIYAIERCKFLQIETL